MTGEIKKLSRSEGVSVGAPTELMLDAGALKTYASDAAYVTAKGSAAVDGDAYYNTTTDTARVYAADAWTDLGSGSGTGINYMTNGDFEKTTVTTQPDGWELYVDAAAINPVDGTGDSESAQISFLANATTPLRGNLDGRLYKSPGTATQGEGISFDFAIDKADYASVMKISFDYSTTSAFDYGTNGDATNPSDVTVWIYDDDEDELIQLAPYTLDGSGEFAGYFQTHATSVNYRLIFHLSVPDAHTNSWSLYIDNVVVGPPSASASSGRVVAAKYKTAVAIPFDNTPAPYDTLVYDSHNAVTTGASWKFTAPIAGVYVVKASVMIANTDWAPGENCNISVYKNGVVEAYLSRWQQSITNAADSSALYIHLHGSTDVQLNAGEYIDIRPIGDNTPNSHTNAGYNQITILLATISNTGDADTRVVALEISDDTPTHTFSSGFAVVKFASPARNRDTHAKYNSSTGGYTIPVSGYYNVSMSFLVADSGTWSAKESIISALGVNSTSASILRHYNSAIAGDDYLSVSFNGHGLFFDAGTVIYPLLLDGGTTAAHSFAALDDYNYFHVVKTSGSASIAASGVVSAHAKRITSSQTVTAGGWVTVIFNDDTDNSHGSYDSSTGIFSCPISGRYEIIVNLGVTMGGTAPSNCYSNLVHNSTAIDAVYADYYVASKSYAQSLHGIVNCNVGDQLFCRVRSTTQDVSVTQNYASISFKRIGGGM